MSEALKPLTDGERAVVRSEILTALVSRHGMAIDPFLPHEQRDHYRARVQELHRIYTKLGGHLSIAEISR